MRSVKGERFFLKEIMRNTKARDYRGLWGAGRTQEWVSRSKVVSKGQGEPGCSGIAGGHGGKIFLRVNQPSKLWGN